MPRSSTNSCATKALNGMAERPKGQRPSDTINTPSPRRRLVPLLLRVCSVPKPAIHNAAVWHVKDRCSAQIGAPHPLHCRQLTGQFADPRSTRSTGTNMAPRTAAARRQRTAPYAEPAANVGHERHASLGNGDCTRSTAAPWNIDAGAPCACGLQLQLMAWRAARPLICRRRELCPPPTLSCTLVPSLDKFKALRLTFQLQAAAARGAGCCTR